MRVARIGLLAALVLAASGCGAAKQTPAIGGASLVPATAPAFVSIDSDLSSDQWKKVDALLRKFPGRSQLLAAINSTSQGLDYEKDVKPALGPELDIVWLDFANGGSNAVAITQPKSDTKFKALIDKANASDPSSPKAVIGKVGDWTVVSDSQATIDRFGTEAASATKLADDGAFKDAMARLPGDSAVKVYAKGKSLFQAVQQVVPGTMPRGTFDVPPAQQPEYIAAALAAESDGFRFAAASRLQQDPKAAAYKSKFVGDVPGDALAFFTFRGGDQLSQVQSNPAYQQGLRQFEQMLGIKVAPLLGLLKGEVAFYVRPQAPIPELTLVAEAADEKSALTLVDGLMFGSDAEDHECQRGWNHREERELRAVRRPLRSVRREADPHER